MVARVKTPARASPASPDESSHRKNRVASRR